MKNISVPIFEGKLQPKKSKKPQTVYFAKKINQQLQKLPTTISDNNLLRFKNVGKNALSNVSNQFARFKGKFTGSTRSNINLPDVIYELDSASNDMRNNSCTSLSIVNEDTIDYVKTSLKPRLTDPSSIASSSSIALYTTTEEEAERTLSSEYSSTDEMECEEEDEDFSQNDEEYSKSAILDVNDTLLESCGILSTSKHHRPKSETGIYVSDEVDDFVLDSMKKQSLRQSLNEVKRKACSPRITLSQDFRPPKDFRSSDCFLNTTVGSTNYQDLDNSVSCANLNSRTKERPEHQRASLGDHSEVSGFVDELSPVKLNLDDCTRSTMDIYSTRNTKHNHNPSMNQNRIKPSKSETPLNDLNESPSRTATTIGKRNIDLLFNGGLSRIARGMNISLISRRYNKSMLSTEELEALTERKNRSKSLIMEIE